MTFPISLERTSGITGRNVPGDRIGSRSGLGRQDGGDAHLAARMGVRTRTDQADAQRLAPHIRLPGAGRA